VELSVIDTFSKVIQLTFLSIAVPALCVTLRDYAKFIFDSHPEQQIEMLSLVEDFSVSDLSIGSLELLLTGRESSLRPCSFSFFFMKQPQALRRGFNIPMTAEAAEIKIDKVCGAVGCSKQGQYWLECCLDPFKDMPESPQGFPDLINSPSVVQVVKQSVNVAVPPVAGAGTWDCNIVMNPNVSTCPSTSYLNVAGNVYQQNAGPAEIFGGVEIFSGIAGAPLPNSNLSATLPLPTGYTGNARVLGMAFEVHNTTSDLNRQGSVVVYRQPGAAITSLTSSALFIDPLIQGKVGALDVAVMPTPPNTVANALILPNSRQWKAADGCYCVSTMSDQVNNPTGQNGALPARLNSATAPPTFFLPTILSGTSGTTQFWYPSSSQMLTPFNLSGAYFSGLSNSTTLTVNATWIVERFPDYTMADLIVLATPSPAFDPIAQELYSRGAFHLPAGVKVKENGLGDFVKGVAGILDKAGVPMMGLVPGVVDTVTSMLGKGGPLTHFDKPKAKGPKAQPKGKELAKKKFEAGWDHSSLINPWTAPAFPSWGPGVMPNLPGVPKKGRKKRKKVPKK